VVANDDMPSRGSVPVPDPTKLTTDAVNAATAQWHRELAATREIIEQRIVALEVERKLLLQLMDERAEAIERRFHERDERFAERDDHRVHAVEVALAAARELNDERDKSTEKAAGKFEESVRAQMAQIGALAEASRDALAAQISTLKERVAQAEAASSGAQTQRQESRLNVGQVLSLVGTIIGIVTIAAIIIIATR
jgi:hypothetical protein